MLLNLHFSLFIQDEGTTISDKSFEKAREEDDNDVDYYDHFSSDDKNDSKDIYNLEIQECNCQWSKHV